MGLQAASVSQAISPHLRSHFMIVHAASDGFVQLVGQAVLLED